MTLLLVVLVLVVVVNCCFIAYLISDIATHSARAEQEPGSVLWLGVISFFQFLLSTFGISDYAVGAAVYSNTNILRGKYLISGAPETSGVKEWLGMADDVLATARALRCMMGEIYCHIISVCALLTIGDVKQAEFELKAALDLALPDRLYMPF